MVCVGLAGRRRDIFQWASQLHCNHKEIKKKKKRITNDTFCKQQEINRNSNRRTNNCG